MRTPSTSSLRPEKTLVVKCKCGELLRKITFSSARTCTVQLLQSRLEQCFRLPPAAYTIQYKDDDNELAPIATEGELTDAIAYFDAPAAPTATTSYPRNSMGSFDSWQQRKITMYIDVVPDSDDDALCLLERRSSSGSRLSRGSSATGRSERLYPLGAWTHLDAIAERGASRSEGSTPQAGNGSGSGNDRGSREPDDEYRTDVIRVLQRAEALEAAARIMRDHIQHGERDWVRAMACSELGEEIINFVAATQYQESLAGSHSDPSRESRSSRSR